MSAAGEWRCVLREHMMNSIQTMEGMAGRLGMGRTANGYEGFS